MAECPCPCLERPLLRRLDGIPGAPPPSRAGNRSSEEVAAFGRNGCSSRNG